MTRETSLQKNIMKRVYYTYALRLGMHTVALHLYVLAILGYLLARFVHVAAVYKTVANIPVGDLLPGMVRLISHADWPTLVIVGLAIFTALSLRFRITLPRIRVFETA